VVSTSQWRWLNKLAKLCCVLDSKIFDDKWSSLGGRSGIDPRQETFLRQEEPRIPGSGHLDTFPFKYIVLKSLVIHQASFFYSFAATQKFDLQKPGLQAKKESLPQSEWVNWWRPFLSFPTLFLRINREFSLY
jgi:hypothetical protein